MRFSSFKYLFKQGWHNFVGNRLMSIASVGVVTSCLILVGMCGSLVLNVNSFVQYLGAQNEVVIYMDDTATLDQVNAINTSLESDEDVASFRYVSKEEALQEQMEYMGRYESLLSGYQGENNPLPASFRVECFRESGNACRNLGVNSLPVEQFGKPTLLRIGEVREVTLSVRDLLHALLSQSLV